MEKLIGKAGVALLVTSVLCGSLATMPAQANGRGNAYLAAGAAGAVALFVWHPWNRRGKGVHFVGGNSAYLPENARNSSVSIKTSPTAVISTVYMPSSSTGGSTGMGSTSSGLKHTGADPGGTTSVTIGNLGAS